MKTKIRREREFLQRESDFLDLARRIIYEGGLSGFSMDKLAEATEYSKGTIYQHFNSKEDLLAALTIQSLSRRVNWFERAARFSGTTRERMCSFSAAEEIFITLQPLYFRSEMMIKVDDIGSRASTERLTEIARLENECMRGIRGVVEEALKIGDLTLPRSRTAGEVVTGFAALHIGTFTIIQSFPQLYRQSDIDDPLKVLRTHLDIFLDGLGWKPLSKESQSATIYSRIFQEVFPHESQQCGRTD